MSRLAQIRGGSGFADKQYPKLFLRAGRRESNIEGSMAVRPAKKGDLLVRK
jgi:hypothetical protein